MTDAGSGSDGSFVLVCAEDELLDGEIDAVDLPQGPVLLARFDGVYRAYQGHCPHQSVQLVEGALDGARLTCRGHNWVFDLTTGDGVNPRRACLARYPVEIREGDVYVGTTAERPGRDATGVAVAAGAASGVE